MSSLTDPVVSWSDFVRLPERPETGKRYELHDGEVVVAPPARPRHIKLQKRIERLLESLAVERGVIATEFPYRPAPNLPVLGCRYRLRSACRLGRHATGRVSRLCSLIDRGSAFAFEYYSQNQPAANDRVDAESKTVTVSRLDSAKVYGAGETLAVALLAGVIAVDEIFL